MLNHIRSGIVTPEVDLFFSLCELNQEDLDELEGTRRFTYLASKRDTVEQHNKTCHDLLTKANPTYPVRLYLRRRMLCEDPAPGIGEEKLDLLEKRIPEDLHLLAGSRVMITQNLDVTRGLVNGRCGTVVSVASEDESVQVVLDGAEGEIESLQQHCWIGLDVKSNQRYEVYQLPVIRSWGFTIHKSQGQVADFVCFRS